MLVAAIYDIHANLPALEAVLEEIRQVGADHVVVGGDVLPGPMPRETLTYLLDLGIPVQFIYGNGEIAVLEQMARKDPATVPEHYRPVIRWTAQQLRPEYEGLLAQFDRMVGTVRVVNAGSVGMPFGEPGADWLLLGPDVQLRHTRYDLAKAAEQIRDTGYPQAHDFAANNVLQPPSETKMLDLFTRAELR